MLCTGIRHVVAYIFPCLRSVEVLQLALQVDPLADRRIRLQIQAVPQLILANQDQCHGTLRIHLEVEQKTHFLQHLTVQQMGFVYNHNRLQTVNAAHKLNLSVKLALGVSPVKLRFTAELLQQPLVKMPRCQLGIRKIKHLVLGRIQHFCFLSSKITPKNRVFLPIIVMGIFYRCFISTCFIL